MSTIHSPPPLHYQPSSPLETLVRSTSARRPNNLAVNIQSPSSSPTEGSSPQYPRQNDTQDSHDGLSNSPDQTHGRPLAAPASPLLHSHFARASVITTGSANASSYLDFSMDEHSGDSVDSKNVYQEDLDYNYEESVYSTNTALRDSWQSEGSGALRHLDQGVGGQSSYPTHSQRQFYNGSAAIPTVVVTEHQHPDHESPMDSLHLKQARKASIIHNFSRPIRPSAVPVLMPAEEEKRKVMERNANRKPRQPRQSHELPTSSHLPSPRSPRSPEVYFGSPPNSGAHSEYHTQPHHRSQSPPFQPRSPQGYIPHTHPNSPSQDPLPPQNHQSSPSMSYPYPSPLSSRPTSPSSPDHTESHHRNTSREMSSPTHSHRSHTRSPIISSTHTTLSHSPSKVVLPRRPPSLRPGSPASLYSRYSFYQLDSPSPNGSTHFTPRPDPEKLQHKKSASSMMLSSAIQPRPPEPETQAHHFLQLGIQHHEANQLKESAVCFEKSAKEEGGCGVGMLMYGLTLRHGWGCAKNEKVGFKWLRNAAESAVNDLESARNGGGIDQGAVRAELILAIYEVGQCFFHGWGVLKDQKMAVSYYRVAARLGDADAQNDLGFCLASGKGCKKDRKEAAKWYRAAVEQGQSDVGLAWIYKDKFQ